MTGKPKLLVLDGQGVVFEAPIKKFLHAFAADNELEPASVEERWNNQYRDLTWTGQIDDEQLWNELAGKKTDVKKAMQAHLSSYQPGPVAGHLLRWSHQLPIWLLSNHRAHWLMPWLHRAGLHDAFQKYLISDSTGFVKPDPASFHQLTTCGIVASDILFVDDQWHNVEAARAVDIRAIHASPKLEWVEQIEVALSAN